MKTTIFTMAMMAMISGSAMAAPQGADVPVRKATCRDASNIADAGYLVTITQGGFAGITQANLFEETIAGPQKIKSYIVTASEGGMQNTYTAEGFSLEVTMESFAPTSTHPASLKATTPKGEVEANLVCTYTK